MGIELVGWFLGTKLEKNQPDLQPVLYNFTPSHQPVGDGKLIVFTLQISRIH